MILMQIIQQIDAKRIVKIHFISTLILFHVNVLYNVN
jgi:hypothetical protein